MFDFWVFVATSAISLMISTVFIMQPSLLTNSQHTLRDISAKQSQHNRVTSRLGGVGIISAFAFGCLIYSSQLGVDLKLSLAAGVLVFWFGLREDIHRNVSPRTRLLAAFGAAGLAIALTGVIVPDLGIFDGFLARWVIPAIAVTLLWSAGTCHAMNLIDGLNGLSSLYSICASFGIFIIAGYTGNSDIQIAAGLLMAAILGFFVLNWPFGRIFLGDAGAYSIGHILAWLSIILIVRSPSIAPAAVLLLLFWPVCDTLFSIIRRRLMRRPTDQPDRLHFHHLVVRALPLLSCRARHAEFDNPVATLLLVPFFCVPIVVGIVLWDRPIGAAIVLVLFIILFVVTYNLFKYYLTCHRPRQPIRFGLKTFGHRIPKEEKSLLSGPYSRDGKLFSVYITKRHASAFWTLQVSSLGANFIALNERFKTDADAFAYFTECVASGATDTTETSLRNFKDVRAG